MSIEEIRKIKYFRYIDDPCPMDRPDESDLIANTYQIREVDEGKEVVRAWLIFSWDPDYLEEIPFSYFEAGKATPLDSEDVERAVEKRNRKAAEATRKFEEDQRRKFEEREKAVTTRFNEINPPLKRGTKVKILGLKGKKAFDFCGKEDQFFIDDVYLENGETFYRLRVTGQRKNRGTYTFYPEKGFKGESLEIDVNPTTESEGGCAVVNGTEAELIGK